MVPERARGAQLVSGEADEGAAEGPQPEP
jgi:hypothetical protein